MTAPIAHRSPEGTLPSRRRLTYEEVIDYIARDPDKVKYPNRQAKFLRNSFELSFLDTLNFEKLQEQQLKAQKFQVSRQAIQEAAVANRTSAVAEETRTSMDAPLMLPSAPPQRGGFPRNLGYGPLRIATGVARGIFGVGRDFITAPWSFEPPTYYTYPDPPSEEVATHPFDLIFGNVSQALARDQALRESMSHEVAHGSSSSSSWGWGHEPDPPVTLPDETERVGWWNMRLAERIQEEQPVPRKKHFENARESLEETRKQEWSIIPYVPNPGKTVRYMADLLAA